MDTLCTPTIITGALFVAIIFNDLLRHEFENLPGHSMLGVVSVLLMAGLCQRGALLVAWGLLLLPLTVVLIILVVQLATSKSSGTPVSNEAPADIDTDEHDGYYGAFMYRNYDWSKHNKRRDDDSPSSGNGGTGTADLPICSDCKKKKCVCDT